MAAEEKEDQTMQDSNQVNPADVPFWLSSRLGLALLGFLGFINVYAIRVNLSVAIVCMVNHTTTRQAAGNGTSGQAVDESSECAAVSALGNNTAVELNPLGGNLDWDKLIQGWVLGSFYYGYLVVQIPAGWLATRIGGKWVFGLCMFISSLLTILTPVLSELHYIALIIVRVLLGLFSGVSFPAMHSMWGHWAPPMERSKLMTFTYAGAQIGIVVTFPLSAYLCKFGFAGGWPSIFYITGTASLVWSMAWLLLVSNTPAEHKRISEIEKKYIVNSLHQSVDPHKKALKVPWLKIFTSLPVYAIIIANITSDWGAYTLLTNIPTYINEVLKFDITSNGLVSALPYIAFWLVINLAGWFADFLRDRQILSTGVVRKSFTAFGMIVPAVLLIGLGYIDCSQSSVAIGLLIFAISLTGTQYSGFLINHVDIAPLFAGILFGISNSIASVTGFISPLIVGVITKDNPSREGWQIVFYIAAGIYLFGAVAFTLLSSGELQPWASVKESTDSKANGYEMDSYEKENNRMLNETEAV